MSVTWNGQFVIDHAQKLGMGVALDIAEDVKVEGRRRCPVRTGRLQRSIEVRRLGGPRGYVVVADTEYAQYVHARNPFLANAAATVAARRPGALYRGRR